MIEDKEHDALVEKNEWLTNFDELIAFIKLATPDKTYTAQGGHIPDKTYWTWAKNNRCKYINIRIDMRDGGFVLLNRDGERISLKQLQWQYGDKE